jgi:hypothetical protein
MNPYTIIIVFFILVIISVGIILFNKYNEDIIFVSYDSLNRSNSILSSMILLIVALFIGYFAVSITYKMNKSKNIKFFDFRNIFYGENSESSLHNILSSASGPIIDEEIQKIQVILDELESRKNALITSGSEMDSETTSLKQKAIKLRDAQSDTNDKLLDEFKNTLASIQTQQDNNIEHIDEIYTTYSQRIKKMVDGLVRSLGIIEYQINLAHVTPNLNATIEPLKRLYSAINTTLSNNVSFINNYYSEFKEEDIPSLKIEVDGVQNLGADLERTQKYFQMKGK